MISIDTILRRIGAALTGVGALLIIVGGFSQHGGPNLLGYIGGALGVAGWLLAFVIVARARAFSWLLPLILLGAAGPALAGVASTGQFGFGPQEANDPGLLLLSFALIGFVASQSRSRSIVNRSPVAALTGVSLLLILTGGIIASGVASGTSSDIGVAHFSTHLYVLSAAFGLIGWLLGLIEAGRIQAWGWLIENLLLLNIGALLFGLFGPTAQDVIQTRLQRQQRREAGIA